MSEKRRHQIRTYVTESERDTFAEYARSIGLDQSSLLVLLMLRAVRFGHSDWTRLREAAGRVVIGKAKITAHVTEPSVYSKVASLVVICPDDLSQARICGALVRLELEEKWLGTIVG